MNGYGIPDWFCVLVATGIIWLLSMFSLSIAALMLAAVMANP